jgi:hypothetical protein
MWFLIDHDNLQWQFDRAGASLINKRILVCEICLDVPQEQLRAIIVPADPVPIMNRVLKITQKQKRITLQLLSRPTYAQTGIPVPQGSALTTVDGTNIIAQPVAS